MKLNILISKLTDAGYPWETVETFDRMAMLDKWVDIVIAAKDVHNPSGARAIDVKGYDFDFERKRLEFRMRQWEEKMAERRAQREAEKLGREAQREADIKRLEIEK